VPLPAHARAGASVEQHLTDGTRCAIAIGRIKLLAPSKAGIGTRPIAFAIGQLMPFSAFSDQTDSLRESVWPRKVSMIHRFRVLRPASLITKGEPMRSGNARADQQESQGSRKLALSGGRGSDPGAVGADRPGRRCIEFAGPATAILLLKACHDAFVDHDQILDRQLASKHRAGDFANI